MAKVIPMKQFVTYQFYKPQKHNTVTLDRTQRFIKEKAYIDQHKAILLENKTELTKTGKFVRYLYEIHYISKHQDFKLHLDIDELHDFIVKN